MKKFFHIIRSSKTNLETLEGLLNDHTPGSMIQPKLHVLRRTRKSRRPVPHKTLMYPGYAFVTPESKEYLIAVKHRYSHHYIRSPLSLDPARVPDEQVQYSLKLEQRSLVMGVLLDRGSRVEFTDPDLIGLRGTVQECRGHYARVWLDDHDFPITCLLTDLRIMK